MTTTARIKVQRGRDYRTHTPQLGVVSKRPVTRAEADEIVAAQPGEWVYAGELPDGHLYTSA